MFNFIIMKFSQLLSVVVLVGLLSCGSEEGVSLSGLIKQPMEGGKVYVERLSDTGVEVVDSINFDANGKFDKKVAVEQASFYRLNFYDRQYVNLVLTGEEESVYVEVDGDRPNGLAVVQGSKDTDFLIKINEAQEKRKGDESLLNQEAIQARMDGDQQAFNDIVNQYQRVDRKNEEALKVAIWDAAPSLAAIYGINYLDIETNFSFVDSLSTKFEEELPGHPFTVNLSTKVEAYKRLAVGSEAPEIALPGPDGDIVTLSSLRGNYVLIDFWAAWCRPCRAENPNVVRLYNKYSQENFEILGVSLDRTRQAWLKAIEDDGLTWKHVSDLKYYNSEAAMEYQISAIPATYLVGPDGKIVAKGLRGESLRAKLEEIFG